MSFSLVTWTRDHPIVDPASETSSHGLFVFLDSSGKGLEFRKVAICYLVKPGIEVLSSTGAQHLGKLLNQVIGQIDLWVKLTKLGQRFLLFGAQFFRPMKKQEGSLS